MTLDAACPEPMRLRLFALGQVPTDEAASVQAHLNNCSGCRAQLADAEAGKTVGDDFESLNGCAVQARAGPAESERTYPVAPELLGPENTLASESDQSSELLSAQSSDATCNYKRPDAPVPAGVVPAVAASSILPTDVVDPNQTGALTSGTNANDTHYYEPGDGPAPNVRTRRARGALESVVVPGYVILEELGRGGMGVVYKARHVRLQRLVALKMILAGTHAGAAGLARFRAEAEAVAQLQHANIVQIYETGEHEGRPYFSLEFVDGGRLDLRNKESPTTPRAAAQLVETLARTMDVAHQRGIVHRDLKPSNILLATMSGQSSVLRKAQPTSDSLGGDHWTRTSVPKIADFGLAKRVDDDSMQTQSGTILGTPSYMAPEQAEGKIREVGPAADIYSLGAILYDLLTGRPPFKAGSPVDTIRQVIEQEPVPPRQLEPRVPHDLETICLKCLRKEAARRYGTAEELADDLHRFLQDEPIHARPTPAWERAWKWGKRRPAIVALLGVSLLAILGTVLFITWHNVSLRGQLDQALEEERLAKQREQNVLEAQRLERVENEGQSLFDDARLAVAARDWPNARVHLTKALATIGNEARFEALRNNGQTLLQQVEQELRVDADRRASQERHQKFVKLRDEAQFLGTLYTGMDLAANLQATRATALQALAVYGVSAAADQPAPPPGDACLDAVQKAELREDCYQLLLILAEAQAQSAAVGGPDKAADAPAPEKQLGEALRLLARALRFGEPSRAYHLRRARYLSLLGDQAEAAAAEKAARDAAVLQVLDHFLVADEFYRRGSYDEAIKEFDQVLERRPGHFWANYLSAMCLLRLQRPAEARAHLSACLATRADFVWLYLMRGFAQGELQAYAAAEADYQKAAQLPLDDNARYVLLVNRGVLRVRQERFDEAITDLNDAIGMKPNEYQAYVNLAQAYRRLKKLDLALAQLDKAVDLEPVLATVYRLRARLHLERQDPTLALRDFDRAIALTIADSPSLVDDHVERGRLLLRERRYVEALASLDKALAGRKDHALAQRLRGEALFQLGQFQEVVEAFDRYLEAGKPLESVYRGRGLARAELGKYPGAIEDFTRALELQPTSAVQAYRGWAHLVCEAPKLALRDFELAIELDAANSDAYNGRGFVRASEGRTAEAIKDAEAALRHGPPSSRLLYNAARIHAKCGAVYEPRALELIRQAMTLVPAEKRADFWTTHVRTDAALQPLRRHPLFLEMEAAALQRK